MPIFMNTTHKPHVVMCVDDDLDDRELLCSIIKRLHPNYEVMEAENGIHANHLLQQAKLKKVYPSLIILDINMPEMNGKETLVELKKDKDLSKIPVVVYSTSSNSRDKAFFSKYKVDMVTKPATINSITNEVKNLLTLCSYSS